MHPRCIVFITDGFVSSYFCSRPETVPSTFSKILWESRKGKTISSLCKAALEIRSNSRGSAKLVFIDIMSINGDDDETVSGLLFNPVQLEILRWAPVIPALFSIGGSLLIIQRIFRSKESLLTKTYERLMFGLSVVDTLNSVRMIIFPLAFRPFTEPSAACTIDGFLITLCFSGPMYNAALACYYVLVIVYNMPQQRIARRYELWLHVAAIGYGIVGALVGLPLQVYNPEKDGLACWAAEWPHGCAGSETCERGASAAVFSHAVGIVPLLGVFLVLMGANAVIYATVRRIHAKTEKYTNPTLAATANSSVTLPNASTKHESPATSCTGSVNPSPAPTTTSATKDSDRLRSSSSTASRTKAVAVQSILYVLAYLLSFIWALIMTIVGLVDPVGVAKGNYFFLNLLQIILYPVQGLLNAFVYVRPMVARLQRQDPSRSRWECTWEVLLLV